MKLYFVRHGQTYLNKYKKMQGWSDSPLTLEGEAVAQATGQRLKQVPFAAVYTSDLGRTIQTAKLIVAENQVMAETRIQPMAALRETFFGSFEADYGKDVYPKIAEEAHISTEEVFNQLSMDEISAIMKELDPYDDVETAEAFRKRMLEGVAQIIEAHEEHPTANILIVTHGNTIRHFVKSIDASVNVGVEIENSSMTIVTYHEGVFQLEGFNL